MFESDTLNNKEICRPVKINIKRWSFWSLNLSFFCHFNLHSLIQDTVISTIVFIATAAVDFNKRYWLFFISVIINTYSCDQYHETNKYCMSFMYAQHITLFHFCETLRHSLSHLCEMITHPIFADADRFLKSKYWNLAIIVVNPFKYGLILWAMYKYLRMSTCMVIPLRSYSIYILIQKKTLNLETHLIWYLISL